jgi:hypothetical protein
LAANCFAVVRFGFFLGHFGQSYPLLVPYPQNDFPGDEQFRAFKSHFLTLNNQLKNIFILLFVFWCFLITLREIKSPRRVALGGGWGGAI